MKQFVVESGIPVPEKRRKSRFSNIPFSEMKIGESIVLDVCLKNNRKKYKNIYSSIYKLIRNLERREVFKIGTVSLPGNKMEIRLWRVE